jgi:hypothetical protein
MPETNDCDPIAGPSSASTRSGNFLDSNLTQLEGLRAYSQETLEHEVSRQIENEITARDREREVASLKTELSLVEIDVKKHQESLKNIEKRLEEICSAKVFVNSRKCQGLLDEQEKARVKLAEAEVLKDEITKELEKFESVAAKDKRY